MAEPTVEACAPTVKKCSQCKHEKQIWEFEKKANAPDRLKSICEACLAGAKRKYRENRARNIAIARKWQAIHADELRAKRKEKWRELKAIGAQKRAAIAKSYVLCEKNRWKARLRKKKIRYADKPLIYLLVENRKAVHKKREGKISDERRLQREAHRKSYRSRPEIKEKEREYTREAWWRNPEESRKKSREWYQKNHEKCLAKANKWRLANKPKRAEFEMRRKARKKALTIGDTATIQVFYDKVHKAKRVTCYWCNQPIPKAERTVDHIVPLAKGGAHAVFNLCAACCTCNSKKNSLLPEQFSGQFQLNFHATAQSQPGRIDPCADVA